MKRILPCAALLMTLAACSHPHPPEDNSRAGLLRPVSASGTATPQDSTSSGRKGHGHLSMGSGYGGSGYGGGSASGHGISGPTIGTGLGGF